MIIFPSFLSQPFFSFSVSIWTSLSSTSDGVRSDCFQNTAFIFSTHFHDGDRVSAEHSNAESVSSLRGSLDSVRLTSSAEIRLEQMRICQTSCMQFKLDTHDRERGERIVASLLVGNLGFDNASGADSNEQRSNFFCDSLQDEFLGGSNSTICILQSPFFFLFSHFSMEFEIFLFFFRCF